LRKRVRRQVALVKENPVIKAALDHEGSRRTGDADDFGRASGDSRAVMLTEHHANASNSPFDAAKDHAFAEDLDRV
jgi:hypothetical protein